MLLPALLIAWSLVTLLVVALCLMAARGDRRARSDRFAQVRSDWLAWTGESAHADTRAFATPFDAHPLELLLQDQRKNVRPLTDRAAR